MKTLLVGSYGECNGGDDAFVEVVVNGLEKYCKPSNLIATSPVQITTSSSVVNAYVSKRLIKGQHFLQRYLSSRKLDRILYAGGGIHTHANILRSQRLIIERNPSCIVAAIGVSVGPFKDQSSIDECKRLLEKFSFIGVRGKISYERLVEMDLQANYELTFDIAVLLRKILSDSCNYSQREERTIGISLLSQERRGLCAETDKKLIDLVASVVNELILRGKCNKIKLIDFCCHQSYSDFGIHEELKTRLNKDAYITHRKYDNDPISLYKSVAESSCILATRLHSAIFAYTSEVPFIMLPYEEKCFEWADMVGLPEKYLFDSNGFDTQVYADRIEHLMEYGKPETLLTLNEAIMSATRNWEVLSALEF